MSIKRPGLLAATLAPIAFDIFILFNSYSLKNIDGALSTNAGYAIPYLIGYFLPAFAISYTIWGICVLIEKLFIKPKRREKIDIGNPQTEIKNTHYITVKRDDISTPLPKVVYVKVATRKDIPEGVEYDDQSGKKIVYVVMDED